MPLACRAWGWARLRKRAHCHVVNSGGRAGSGRPQGARPPAPHNKRALLRKWRLRARMCAGTGMVLSWGRGEDGQLGHGDADERAQPHAVHALLNTEISSVICGAEYSVALSRERQEVYSWGWCARARAGA
jgi:hypothetical protein